MHNFSSSYQKLNKEQQKAVDAIEGPVMVLAGPGTGKTQILAMRIANILLKTDTNPSSILALTFTESGASAMKKRLISLIGETAYQVNIQTFHSFCNDVIQSNPEHFPELSEGEALADFDRFELFQSLFQNESLDILRPANAPLLYVRSAMQAIQDLKREGISPEKFEKILHHESKIFESQKEDMKKGARTKSEKLIAKNSELLHLYSSYQKAMKKLKKFDFEDMITLTIRAFEEHADLLTEYQERLQYFLVDEYQDTNSAQNNVLSQLASYWKDHANVFVVGDPNQSIYRFQGASLENTFSFLETYPQATVIALRENYRSTQTILNVASTLLHKSAQKTPTSEQLSTLHETLNAQKLGGIALQYVEAETNSLEHIYIAEKISSLLTQGVPPQEIAIIVRHNADLTTLAETLYRWGIPTEVEGGRDILTYPLIDQLLSLFRAILNIRVGGPSVNFFTVMNYSWLNLPSMLILKLSRFSAIHKTEQLSVLLDKKLKQEFVDTLSEEEYTQLLIIQKFVEKLHEWQYLDVNSTFPQWFETVITESGFLDHMLSRIDRVSQLNKLNSLFSEVKRLAHHDHQLHLSRFIEIVDVMIEHRISLNEQALEKNSNAVRLITAHKSKGLEWQHVFITTMIDKKWGNNVVKNLLPLPEGILQHTKAFDTQKNEDERRLFYVALTRAKEAIYITSPQILNINGSTKETTPSLFIEEIQSKYIENKSIREEVKDIERLLPKLLSTQSNELEIHTDEQAFLHTILERFKLSPTALNTYLECPYKFKLNNLYKIPRAKQPFLSFGTAIHTALEFYFSEWKKYGDAPTLKETQQAFTTALQKELLTEKEFVIREKKGIDLLTSYFDNYVNELVKPLFTEKPFGFGFSKTVLDDIPLSGKVDKIEWINPQEKLVKVVDYKTGRPKSRNEIEGKTKNSNGNYKRQLVFYKLLTELDRTFKLKVEEAEFDFVQPMSSGKMKKESFHIVQEEVDALKQLIRETMEKVRNFEFPKTEDRSICEECEFKKHCWGETSFV